jgi:hypothetical protein
MRPEHTARVIAQRSKGLWIVVVHPTIDAAKGGAKSASHSPNEIRSIQREALTWIFHDRSRVANAFHSICGRLDPDPDGARQRLRQVPAIRRGVLNPRGDVERGEG